jgi:hypothetical protein
MSVGKKMKWRRIDNLKNFMESLMTRYIDMKSSPDTKLDLVEALFYASIIVVLSAVGMISSVR